MALQAMKEISSPEPWQLPERLVTAVARDFPEAQEILVGFRDEWELVRSLGRQDQPLYAAAFPWEEERPRRDHFSGLSAGVNLSLNQYRHHQLFRPWKQPTIQIAWDMETGEGRVLPGGHLNVRLQCVAEAQVWAGESVGVIWECYLLASEKPEQWQEELAAFWGAVEADMRVAKIYTLPQDPAFPEGYSEFLEALGYQPDSAFPLWWSKAR